MLADWNRCCAGSCRPDVRVSVGSNSRRFATSISQQADQQLGLKMLLQLRVIALICVFLEYKSEV